MYYLLIYYYLYMDMSNTDITSRIIEIIQPFLVDGTSFIINQDLNVIKNDQLDSQPSENDRIEPKIILKNMEPISEVTSEPIKTTIKNVKMGYEIKRRPMGFNDMVGNNKLTPGLLAHLLSSEVTSSIGGELSDINISNLNFKKLSEVNSQPTVEKPIKPIDKNILYCEHCDFYTNDQICLMDHTLINHDGAFNEYMCDICDHICFSIYELDTHIEENHKKKSSVSKKIHGSNIGNNSNQPDLHDLVDNKGNNSEEEDDEDDCQDWSENEQCDEKQSKKSETNIKSTNKNTNDSQISSNPNDKFVPYFKRVTTKIFGQPPKPVLSTMSDLSIKLIDEHIDQPELSKEEITKKNLYKWSLSSGKFECQVCKLRFRSQNYLGEHFILNHQTYEEQLELDTYLNMTSFPGFEVLSEAKYCIFPENTDYYEKFCEICCEQYLVNHNKQIKTINAMYLDEYTYEILYPVVTNCCLNNSACHKCIKGYLNESYLNGLLYCPFCQQDRTIYGSKYISVTDIQCNKKTWQKWWSKNNRIDLLASSKHSLKE